MEKKLELDKSLVFAEVSMMVPKQVDAVQAATWAPWPRQARSLLVDPKVVLELDLSLVFAAVSKEGPKQVVAMPWAAWCWRLWTRSLLHFVGSWEAYWRWPPLVGDSSCVVLQAIASREKQRIDLLADTW